MYQSRASENQVIVCSGESKYACILYFKNSGMCWKLDCDYFRFIKFSDSTSDSDSFNDDSLKGSFLFSFFKYQEEPGI